MKTFIKYSIKSKDIQLINDLRFELPKPILNGLIDLKEVLLKIAIPYNCSMIYSLINNSFLNININLNPFFLSLCENDKLYFYFKEISYNSERYDFQLYISKNKEMKDILISGLPIVSTDLISYLKKGKQEA